MPRIRSERPAFELHYPHMVGRLRREAHTGHSDDSPATYKGANHEFDSAGNEGEAQEATSHVNGN